MSLLLEWFLWVVDLDGRCRPPRRSRQRHLPLWGCGVWDVSERVAPAAAARLALLPRPRRTLARAALRAALGRGRGSAGCGGCDAGDGRRREFAGTAVHRRVYGLGACTSSFHLSFRSRPERPDFLLSPLRSPPPRAYWGARVVDRSWGSPRKVNFQT